MTPNPFSGLIHSRKFWLAVVDAAAAILALWLGTLAPEQTAQLIMATWGAIQPVLIIVIAAIAYEDKARMEAASRDLEAIAYSELTNNELRAMLTEVHEQDVE